eukprot:366212-Chlamydomonas_euryale.AAC.43
MHCTGPRECCIISTDAPLHPSGRLPMTASSLTTRSVAEVHWAWEAKVDQECTRHNPRSPVPAELPAKPALVHGTHGRVHVLKCAQELGRTNLTGPSSVLFTCRTTSLPDLCEYCEQKSACQLSLTPAACIMPPTTMPSSSPAAASPIHCVPLRCTTLPSMSPPASMTSCETTRQ